MQTWLEECKCQSEGSICAGKLLCLFDIYWTAAGFSLFILKNVIIAVACSSCLFVPRPDVAYYSRFDEWRVFAFGFLRTINPLPCEGITVRELNCKAVCAMIEVQKWSKLFSLTANIVDAAASFRRGIHLVLYVASITTGHSTSHVNYSLPECDT